MPDVLEQVTGFAHALRAQGVAADRTRLTTSIEALAEVDPMDVEQVYWATRLTLCSEPDDLPKFDAQFDRWFRGRRPRAGSTQPQQARPVTQLRSLVSQPNAGTETDAGDDQVVKTAASDTEVLRHRDLDSLTGAERDEINRMIALLAPRVGTRRSARRRRGGHDSIDISRTVRTIMRNGGEPARFAYEQPRVKPRRLVLLIDVSGSMAPYADALLRFAHAAARVRPASTEVFTIGTRLTRVTRQLRLRDPERALQAAGQAVPDWSGGTRLGEAMRAFLDRWGQRGTARRAVVVIASDGWERGDAKLLGEQLARLHRLAHSVVWVNPHKGRTGFEPQTGGMLAALPHIDHLVAGHSFEALQELAEVVAHA